MTDWWKAKKEENANQTPDERRAELIKSARAEAEKARDAIGRDRLAQLKNLIDESQKPAPPKEVEPSPMTQAQEILKKIDHVKMLEILRALRGRNETH